MITPLERTPIRRQDYGQQHFGQQYFGQQELQQQDLHRQDLHRQDLHRQDLHRQDRLSSYRQCLDFNLPPELEAGEPPEARGLARDQVRLMVSRLSDGRITHTRFQELPNFTTAGDVLVINTSGTLNAALPAVRSDGSRLELHLSTHLPGELWVVELRKPEGSATLPFYEAERNEALSLPGGAQATLLAPYHSDQRHTPEPAVRIRLWLADLHIPVALDEYLERYGFPIRYKYVRESWPSSTYQTVYTTEKGSAEMPSAGRAFTPELVTQLVARGVRILPLILHTGVASLEEEEPTYEEFYRVPAVTAQTINAARSAGQRVLAVGTTVVRALETVTDEQGTVHPGEGWTQLVIRPQDALRSIDGLLTGLHEPRSTHLSMLAALAGFDHLCCAYQQALQEGYLWHEFGDLHLILP